MSTPTTTTTAPTDPVREAVRARYGAIATSVSNAMARDTIAPDGPSTERAGDPISGELYSAAELAALPAAAVLASLGCGNPTALAQINPGDVVLDLGSGGGIDVLLSARRAGPTGFAYGLDMTDEMLALAHRNATAQGVSKRCLSQRPDRGHPVARCQRRSDYFQLRHQPQH